MTPDGRTRRAARGPQAPSSPIPRPAGGPVRRRHRVGRDQGQDRQTGTETPKQQAVQRHVQRRAAPLQRRARTSGPIERVQVTRAPTTFPNSLQRAAPSSELHHSLNVKVGIGGSLEVADPAAHPCTCARSGARAASRRPFRATTAIDNSRKSSRPAAQPGTRSTRGRPCGNQLTRDAAVPVRADRDRATRRTRSPRA